MIDYILLDASLLIHIRQAGYEPFNSHITSDHRGVFVDFHTQGLFSDHPPRFSTKQDLSSKNASQIPKYFQAKEAHLTNHNWYTKL